MSLMEVLAKLQNAHLPLKDNFENLITQAFMSHKRFLREIGVLKSFVVEGLLPQVYGLACQEEVLMISAPLGPEEVVELAKWCKTEVGRAKVNEQRMWCKLKRKYGDAFTVEEIASIELLNAALDDYHNELKRVRSRYEAEIAELQKKIENERWEMERDAERIAQNHPAVASYVPISEKEIVERHWDEWVVERGDDPDAVEKNAKNFREVVKRYRAYAERKYKEDYCKAHLKDFEDVAKRYKEKKMRRQVDINTCAD